MSACKLCLVEAKLCRSHIIPEFAHKTLYDSKHRFRSIYDAKGGKIKWEQKGFREKLLCQRCETALSVYERYAARIFQLPMVRSPGDSANRIHLTKLDYHKLKLFLLSVLWRAGVSELRFHSHVNLGIHEERLRSMVHEGNPGDSTDYGTVLFSLMHEGEALPDFFVEPMPARIQNHNSYLFTYGGFVFVYFISNHNLHAGLRACMLKESGEMIVQEAELSRFEFLRKLWETVARNFPPGPGDELRHGS